jgi:hypothetical protein
MDAGIACLPAYLDEQTICCCQTRCICCCYPCCCCCCRLPHQLRQGDLPLQSHQGLVEQGQRSTRPAGGRSSAVLLRCRCNITTHILAFAWDDSRSQIWCMCLAADLSPADANRSGYLPYIAAMSAIIVWSAVIMMRHSLPSLPCLP